MNKLINKNLIVLFAVFALILSFAFVKTVSAKTVTIGFGADNSVSENTDNNNNNDNYYNQNSRIPVITSISPASATSGVGGKSITINGYNFIPGSVARWNGSDRNTSFVSSNQLIMYTTDYDMSGLGNYPVTVYNHASNGGISNTKTFTLNKPVVSSSTTSNTTKKTTSSTATKKATATETCATASTTKDSDGGNDLTASAIFGSNGFLPNSFLQWMLLIVLVLMIVIVWRKVSGANSKYHEKPLKHA